MKKLLLVYNPFSGDGRIRYSLADLVELFSNAGFLTTLYPTHYAGDAKNFIQTKGAFYDRIIVCGGDGMMHEAINGWMQGLDMPLLGYIPSGTVNDFASTHDIPKDLMEAAQVASGKTWSSLDSGTFNGEYFAYVAAFGIGTSVSYRTSQRKKKRLGSLAYVLEALTTVDFTHWENNCETMKIIWKGGQSEGDFLYGMVSNSKYVAGTDFFTKDLFNWHDGLLEGLFIRRPMNLMELNTIIAGITRSDFSHPLFIQVQSPWFHFECKHAAWTLDGEFGGIHDRVEIKVVPSALKLALPESHLQEWPLLRQEEVKEEFIEKDKDKDIEDDRKIESRL
ncbi:MAG: diacylglycerol kinase family lipid kinase [Allobaculum sp.]|nr:diacylglycerol kinase family lipid kinase [Allobaculum sp.]